ncbi:MAG: YSC84-related protein [Halopseudomonas sp.]
MSPLLKPLLVGLVALCLSVTSHAGWNPLAKEDAANEQQQARSAAAETIAEFKKADPKLQVFFDQAYGYAIFPTVGKGGMGIGGAFGQGLVYRGGLHTGDSKLVQLSIGFQFGGQAYSELIFFKDKAAFKRFTEDNFELSAQASAVAVTAGAAANVDYSDGIAIFTQIKGGLMYEASVGGQTFDYKPL